MSLSVVILSKKEEIPGLLLKSISFADEILVITDTDKYKNEYKKGIIKHIFRPLNSNFADQRNFALQKAKSDWVLFVDDDEYVGTELAREIQSVINRKENRGYLIPRIDVCFHQPLLHGETGHTKILRLARKNSGKFSRPVHETWKVKGSIKEIVSPLYHIKDSFVSEFSDRMAQYGLIDAKSLEKENKPFTYWRLFFLPKAKFIQNYIFRMGFLDGLAGLFQAYLMSVQSLSVRIFQWEKEKQS
jgi:glycosyltransferase involved in cell wall biosynthesis